MKFSANLGFLWKELSLPQAIRAAKSAGFDAVECHWPYETDSHEVLKALNATGLRMLGLNTCRGNTASGENGLSALPGREEEAAEAFAQALEYAKAIGAEAIHVMAGFAEGKEAERTFQNNLSVYCDLARPAGITLLIEPLNRHDAPGYFLGTTDQAREIIEAVNRPNLKLMFDCYHVGRTEGDVITRLTKLLPIIGHIQFASVPDRGPPDQGELNYRSIFDAVEGLGWQQPLGAEYKPNGPTDASLDWMKPYEDR